MRGSARATAALAAASAVALALGFIQAAGCSLFTSADDLATGAPPSTDAADAFGEEAATDASAAPDAGDKTTALDASPPDLVGEWLFDEDGGTVARDTSGRARDGRLTGTARLGPGTRGGALLLDGSGTVEIDALADTAFPTIGTLSVRMRSEVPSAANGTWSILDGWTTERQHIYVRHADTRYQLALMYPADDYALFTFFDLADDWVHFVFTWDTTARTVGIYADGKVVGGGTFTRDFSPKQQRMSLGGGFQGELDELRLYDRAFSATEVAAMP